MQLVPRVVTLTILTLASIAAFAQTSNTLIFTTGDKFCGSGPGNYYCYGIPISMGDTSYGTIWTDYSFISFQELGLGLATVDTKSETQTSTNGLPAPKTVAYGVLKMMFHGTGYTGKLTFNYQTYWSYHSGRGAGWIQDWVALPGGTMTITEN